MLVFLLQSHGHVSKFSGNKKVGSVFHDRTLVYWKIIFQFFCLDNQKNLIMQQDLCFELGINTNQPGSDGWMEKKVILPTVTLPDPKTLSDEDRKQCADFYLHLASQCAIQHIRFDRNWSQKELDENAILLEIKSKKKSKKQLKEESKTTSTKTPKKRSRPTKSKDPESKKKKPIPQVLDNE
jgi:hypothetical protein